MLPAGPEEGRVGEEAAGSDQAGLDLVTVVLPTKNEARNIGRFLASLPPQVNLVVVDSSDDNTAELVRRLRSEKTVIIRLEAGAGVSRARQVGTEAAATPWVLFADADTVFAPDYFSALPRHLRSEMVYGPKKGIGGHRLYYSIFSLGQTVLRRLGFPTASGSNMAVRREVLMAIGGFDPHLLCNEDTDLAFRLVKAGYRAAWAPELVVYNTDHRRLRRGLAWRFAHMLSRCFLLYLSLYFPRLKPWLYSDWGYWS